MAKEAGRKPDVRAGGRQGRKWAPVVGTAVGPGERRAGRAGSWKPHDFSWNHSDGGTEEGRKGDSLGSLPVGGGMRWDGSWGFVLFFYCSVGFFGMGKR